MVTLPIKVTAYDADDKTSYEIDLYPKSKCSICGHPAIAMWNGINEVFVCRDCAINILPRLMADAIMQCQPRIDTILDLHKNSEIAFWQAVASKAVTKKE